MVSNLQLLLSRFYVIQCRRKLFSRTLYYTSIQYLKKYPRDFQKVVRHFHKNGFPVWFSIFRTLLLFTGDYHSSNKGGRCVPAAIRPRAYLTKITQTNKKNNFTLDQTTLIKPILVSYKKSYFALGPANL